MEERKKAQQNKEVPNNIQLSGSLQTTRMDGENEDKRVAEFVISTESVDRHGTVIKMDGWDLENYKRNPIVGYQHNVHGYNANPDYVIGTGEVYQEDKNLIGRVTFEPEGDNDIADKVWRKLQSGVLRSTSVGFIAQDYRWGEKEMGEDPDVLYFTKQELTEFSVVNIPSNADAVKRSIDSLKEEMVPAHNGRNTNEDSSNQNKTELYARIVKLQKLKK